MGINSVDDVECAIVRFRKGEAYQLTSKDTPELVARLYKALLDIGPLESTPPIGDYDTLTVHAKNGRTGTLLFFTMLPERECGKERIFVSGTKHADSLDALLHDVQRNAKAATLGAQMVSFAVSKLAVSLPERKPIEIPLKSSEVDALVAKAKTIVDWLDLRAPCAEQPSSDELAAAERKFGSVTMVLSEPVGIDVYRAVHPTEPPQGGLIPAFKKMQIRCAELVVMDYGNYQPPVVIVRDIVGLNRLYDKLTRRNQERNGVISYDLPGHPVTDTLYYRSPRILYGELQKLARTAYAQHSGESR